MSKATAMFDAGFQAGIGWAINTDNEPLMHAAPDLLEALKNCRILAIEFGPNPNYWSSEQKQQFALIDAAIAKAEGK